MVDQAQAEIAVTDAPAIDGLRFRLPSEADIAPLASMLTATAQFDGLGVPPDTVESVTRALDERSEDQKATTLLAEVGGEIAGFGWCGSWQEASGARRYYHWFFVHPDWRGRGIGRAVLRWQEARVREIAQREAAQDSAPVEQTYKLFYDERAKSGIALITRAGYVPIAYFAQMVRPNLEDIPDVPMPDGLELRPYAPEHLRLVYEAYREAFLDHINGVPASDEDFEQFKTDSHFQDRHLWQVAWDVEKNEVAGCILNYIVTDENEAFERKRGYVEWVSVRRPYRRRGLARAMVAASLRAHKAVGMEQAGLSSHTDNPNKALSLYESMGFRLTHYVMAYQKPVFESK